MNDPGHGSRGGSTLRKCLGVSFILDEVPQTKEKIAYVNPRPVKIKETLQENCDCDNRATEKEPHQGPTFSDQIHEFLPVHRNAEGTIGNTIPRARKGRILSPRLPVGRNLEVERA